MRAEIAELAVLAALAEQALLAELVMQRSRNGLAKDSLFKGKHFFENRHWIFKASGSILAMGTA